MSEIKEGPIDLSNPNVEKPRTFKKGDLRRIVLKANETIRVAFLDDIVEMRYRHYTPGAGYRRCLSHTGFCPVCIAADKNSEFYAKQAKKASEAFGANVFVYKTEEDPSDPAKPVKPLSGDIYLFIFGREKFASLRSIKNMYKSLVGLDLQITCTDEGFQKMTIIAYPKEASYASNSKVMEYMQKKLEKDAYPVEKLIAKEVTPAEMIRDFKLDSAILEGDSENIHMVNSAPKAGAVEVFDETLVGNVSVPQGKMEIPSDESENDDVILDPDKLLEEL